MLSALKIIRIPLKSSIVSYQLLMSNADLIVGRMLKKHDLRNTSGSSIVSYQLSLTSNTCFVG